MDGWIKLIFTHINNYVRVYSKRNHIDLWKHEEKRQFLLIVVQRIIIDP